MTNTVPLTHISADEVKAVLSEYRIHNADISFKEDSTIDDLIDVVEVRKGRIHCSLCMHEYGLTLGFIGQPVNDGYDFTRFNWRLTHSTQYLYPMYLCPQQDWPDLDRRTWLDLQDPQRCPYLCQSRMELWRVDGDHVGGRKWWWWWMNEWMIFGVLTRLCRNWILFVSIPSPRVKCLITMLLLSWQMKSVQWKISVIRFTRLFWNNSSGKCFFYHPIQSRSRVLIKSS